MGGKGQKGGSKKPDRRLRDAKPEDIELLVLKHRVQKRSNN